MLSSPSLLHHPFIILLLDFQNPQLKIDEFESNVNEIKDPFPPADFPGKFKYHSTRIFYLQGHAKNSLLLLHAFSDKAMMRRRILKYQKALDLVQWQICS